ncbi:DUF4406 domain-containing protein [Arenibaculum pallidiluteum]|uniref:DUF4406 domain-containing protein n=1 Tax=Arenibaculum pallidiluteum TaxID=2812559 RepID=UPI001A979798|nr:DUF4406 domain-containing protein [Arenibaculum pallidiluteum]
MQPPIHPMMILVAGPYRSGTGDDPALIAANMRAMDEAALRLFRAGHLPVTGEALALPLITTAGSRGIGDAVWDEIFHPIAERLARRCDACLRIGGASAGADAMAAIFRAAGRPVFGSVEEIPRPA